MLDEFPEFYQLYPRNEDNSSTVEVSGKWSNDTEINGLVLKIFKDGRQIDEQNIKISGNRFKLESKIEAGLYQYKFQLFTTSEQGNKLFMEADSVVCGDAYIITGQSNSHASSTLSDYSSPYCRSFGVKTGFEPYTQEDKAFRWGRASGNCPDLDQKVGGWFIKNPYGVGVWGMELAKLIVEEHQIPVCVINGGSGSSSIEENMLYPELASLETSFGRLAYRVHEAGLKDNIKAIFWHQGESNTSSEASYKSYAQNFETLRQDWKRVYKGLEKIYLFQLHPGCGKQNEGYYNEMLQIQNDIAENYDDVEIMSTLGVKGHDGCHFSYEGYLEFAHRIYPLVSRDFYQGSSDGIITPPKLRLVSQAAEDKIELIFDQPMHCDQVKEIKGQPYFLKDQFFGKSELSEDLNQLEVNNLSVSGNKILLELSKPQEVKYLTYLPGKFYAGTTEFYNGPWLIGKENGIGALGFHQREIHSIELDTFQSLGYKELNDTLNGVEYKIVFPKKSHDKRHWVWRARFWGHEPQTDLALLEKGFHVAYIDVAGLFGSERAIDIWDDFYRHMTSTYTLNKKVVLEGMSRGGLIVFNWSNRNAEKVAAIYVDAPVCDFKSWPGGFGLGKGHEASWQECLKQYGFTQDIALKFNGNPIHHLENLASHKVPILSVVGDADEVVPVSENTLLVKKRLEELGGTIQIIHKPEVGHHPHSLVDPSPIVEFILKNTIKQND